MTAAVLLTLTILAAPHVIGAWRGVRIGRSAVSSHRHSVRLGVRLGRWQTVAVVVMVTLMIGAR